MNFSNMDNEFQMCTLFSRQLDLYGPVLLNNTKWNGMFVKENMI